MALAPATTVLDVADDVERQQPIVILNSATGTSSFLAYADADRSVRAARPWSSTSRVAHAALVVPLSEYEIGDNASLQLVTYQRLD